MNPAMPLDYLVSALVTLLVVVDPVGLTPTFLAVTQGLPAAARRQIALRACLIAGVILAGTALIGDWLLDQLPIPLPAFRFAGGLPLFPVASAMAFGVRIERQSKQAEEAIEEHVRHVAAFRWRSFMAGQAPSRRPCCYPARRTASRLLAGLLGVVVIVVAVCYGVFSRRRPSSACSVTGSVVLSRLLGVLLAALAVQFVIDGVRARSAVRRAGNDPCRHATAHLSIRALLRTAPSGCGRA